LRLRWLGGHRRRTGPSAFAEENQAGHWAVLYRQYQDLGLVGSGTFTSGIEIGEHWDGSGRQARYGRVDWDTVLDYEDRLPLEESQSGSS
jgi:hypothetical protein